MQHNPPDPTPRPAIFDLLDDLRDYDALASCYRALLDQLDQDAQSERDERRDAERHDAGHAATTPDLEPGRKERSDEK